MATHIYNHLQRYHDDIETVEKDEPETAKAISDTMLSIAYKTMATVAAPSAASMPRAMASLLPNWKFSAICHNPWRKGCLPMPADIR